MRQAKAFQGSSGHFGQNRLRNDPRHMLYEMLLNETSSSEGNWSLIIYRIYVANHFFSKTAVSKGDALSIVYHAFSLWIYDKKRALDVIRLINSRIKAPSFGQRRGRSRQDFPPVFLKFYSAFTEARWDSAFERHRSRVTFDHMNITAE